MKRAMFLAALALVSGSMVWAGAKVEVVSAEYGAGAKKSDVTEKVKKMVNEGTFKIAASNDLFGDPAYGDTKALTVKYKLDGKDMIASASEGETLEIKTEAVAAVAIPADARLVIIIAEYGAGDKKSDVTEKVKKMVNEGTKKISASNDLFGDPAVGDGKTLTVKYKLDGKEATATANEGGTLDLP